MTPPDPELPRKALASAAQFKTTRWSIVAMAGKNPSPESAQALEDLCRVYWPPVYAFLRRKGFDSYQSEDLCQGFFEKLLAKNYVAQADRDKGKFRTFLLAALSGFTANEWDRSQRLKRGGGVTFLSMASGEAEERYSDIPADSSTPETLFERRWAETVLEQVMIALEKEYLAAGYGERFQRLKVFLVDVRGALPFVEAANELRLSESAVKSFVHRLRQRYRELLRAEIAQTVQSPDEVDGEIRHLLSALSQG